MKLVVVVVGVVAVVVVVVVVLLLIVVLVLRPSPLGSVNSAAVAARGEGASAVVALTLVLARPDDMAVRIGE